LDLRFYTFNTQQAVIKNDGLIGFNTNTPGNEVEITSRATTPYGLTGSGLKFSNMTSGNATITNPGLGVLSVDNAGNVIMQHLLNDTLLIKNTNTYLFGNKKETISSVIGKNHLTNTLSPLGNALNAFLNFIDKDHSLNSIIYDLKAYLEQ
jgi:hypothetical protein